MSANNLASKFDISISFDDLGDLSDRDYWAMLDIAADAIEQTEFYIYDRIKDYLLGSDK